ncbi:MAG: MFS transporter, partial [Sphaerochaetaceae bacterium]|nr:MFS transporter [Sphaerochaetaceae bacterium]
MTQQLRIRTKLAYGMGDIYGGGATTLISMYYLYYLTDVLQINPALAGTAFLVSKICEAVTDPVMGIINDNTRSRFGRRRPYFLAGIFLIFIVSLQNLLTGIEGRAKISGASGKKVERWRN